MVNDIAIFRVERKTEKTSRGFYFDLKVFVHGVLLSSPDGETGIFRALRAFMPPAGGKTTPPIFFPEKENGRCDRPKERR